MVKTNRAIDMMHPAVNMTECMKGIQQTSQDQSPQAIMVEKTERGRASSFCKPAVPG
ncbi:MAG: hypothetical protein HY962_01155 [Ignavibacteriae bacterium]|nr:hypothetical protein [Ignavibacteriota bacterium]